MEAFRPQGTLSVTDLASPLWCEVQFEYGLRGKRSRPLHKRPKSFKSASGKEIKTDTVVAAQNNLITKTGLAIHKSLEREVKPVEVLVDVMTAEERWALRLVNMLSSLKGMRLEGFTREMPVFGIEDGEIILGVIDELIYQPVLREDGGSKPSPDPAQTRIESYFSSPRKTRELQKTPSDRKCFTLQIVDTKTRKRPTLPIAEDMLSSRLQLMLYHRLLSRLVSPEASFDFMVFWQLANVDPECQLSWRFLEQAGLVADAGDFQVLTLADLSVLWQDLVHQLNIAGVDEYLKLIYRLQPHDRRNQRQVAVPQPDSATKSVASLQYPQTGNYQDAKSTTIPETTNSIQEAVRATTHDASGEEQPILGTKVFNYDPEFVSVHLIDILAWWRGERKPRGVPVELARRCVTCEYCDDCEWREERAREFREKVGQTQEPLEAPKKQLLDM